jgi:hypothetical protein
MRRAESRRIHHPALAAWCELIFDGTMALGIFLDEIRVLSGLLKYWGGPLSPERNVHQPHALDQKR